MYQVVKQVTVIAQHSPCFIYRYMDVAQNAIPALPQHYVAGVQNMTVCIQLIPF
jgi:hypothetical protein